MSATTQDRFARLAALKPGRKRAVDAELRGVAPDIPEGAERLAQLLGATTQRNRYGEHLALRRWFSDPPGTEPSAAAPEGALDAGALGLLAPDAPEEVLDPRQWLFLDTETTGLAGGTGTYAFLVGIAWWDAGGLEVEQFFMREHSEEHSLLVALAERLAERRVLVTFNGKSFDWPLLETRYRMTRAIRTPVPRAHLDLLHPSRNLWRLRLGSVRLAELEKHVLGWNRGADVMSELIPEIYFNFVRGGPAEPLVPVFLHNQMDLRGLAGLSGRILSLLAEPEASVSTMRQMDALELYGVSRICERRGQRKRARTLYQRSIAAELPPETDRAAKRSLARLAKREGDLPLARELWEGMLDNSKEGFEAYEQLAIYYEHHARAPHQAAGVARKALAELRRANRLGTMAAAAYRQCRERFEHRLARLERKAGRSLLDAMEPESQG
ncbi:MAG: ribonuclease H-like domain-containing protein [Candidatus Acidiferrales bacterium]